MSFGISITGNNSQLILDGSSGASTEFFTPSAVQTVSGTFSYNKLNTFLFMQLQNPTGTQLLGGNNLVSPTSITFNQTTWRTNRKIAGGGVLLDQGIHMIDLIRFFAGDINEVKSYVSNNFWNFDVEDNIYAILKTNNDIYSMIHSSATQWRHKFILEINLEKGSLILEGILSGSKSYGEEKLTIVKANPKKDNGDPIEKVLKYNNDPSWAKEIKLFSNFILNNKKVSTGSSKEAYDCMKIIYDIYRGDKVWKKNLTYDLSY